ncbi:hypothetical protein OAU83_00690 [bacterium]|nr:hypothetical protein [bacterium]
MIKKLRIYILISLFTILGTLYIFEIYLANNLIVYEKKKLKLYEKKNKKKSIGESKIKKFLETKKINNSITVPIYPRVYLNKKYDIFPLSGVSNVDVINCNEFGYFSKYKSDRYGFDNPDNEWQKKEIEYFLVGDSFAASYCVNSPNDIASILRDKFEKTTLSLGYGGNGPLIKYASLKEYLIPNTNKVLWMYYEGNDLNNLSKELKNKFLQNYLNNPNFTQNLKLKQNKIDRLSKLQLEDWLKNNNQSNLKWKTNFLKFIKLYYLRGFISKRLATPTPPPLKEFKKIIQLAKNFSTKNKSKLYFIYLPTYNRYNSKYDNNNYFAVKKIINDLQIPFIDIHKEVFEKVDNPYNLFSFRVGGHYNIDGYKKVTDTIYKLTSN